MMEKYFTLQYYFTIAGLVIFGAIILGYLGLIILGTLIGRWKKRQDKKADKFWKEHEDDCG